MMEMSIAERIKLASQKLALDLDIIKGKNDVLQMLFKMEQEGRWTPDLELLLKEVE